MTDAERDRCLRRLRFSGPLAGDVQEHDLVQNRASLRVGLAALTAPLLWYEREGWGWAAPLHDPNLPIVVCWRRNSP